MGSVMLAGWFKRSLKADAVYIVDPELDYIRQEFKEVPEKHLFKNLDRVPAGLKPSFIILAVKPQMMDDVVGVLKKIDLSKTVILSVAAGKNINYFEDNLGKDLSIVRAMPNMPAAIGKGITVCCPNKTVTDDHKLKCTALLKSISLVEWVEEEALMDAVTALSGSGPAYVFHLVEAMAAAGENLGLSKTLSMKLATQTIIGSGALLDKSGVDATKLRETVTSAGGTTAAALDILMGVDGLVTLMNRSMSAAKNRSKELAKY